MAEILDGRALAARIRDEVRREVEAFTARHGTSPALAAILVGDDPASALYVRNKARAAGQVGIRSETFHLPAHTTQGELLELVDRLNGREDVHGILPQLPLPEQLDPEAVFDRLDPRKDVDGLSPYNMGRLSLGRPQLVPCTPLGVLELVRSTGVRLAGARAVVVGRSNLVGKPTALLLLAEHATVTLCHSRTRDLAGHTRQADVLVVAVGRPGLVTAEMVKPGAVVIDVGITRQGDRIVGDVDFEGVRQVAGWLSPVPGGVGPMTVAMLLRNTLEAARLQVEGGAR
ncbi:MAG: bifunctional methylenetetrahydrofolate dehydrogenase/methenyltetrahydrofolate cyclohydrolase FolD [Armatimonadota bacterium]|nr:bifunctional methylenetetrahydrofolate dehydrogenase/methenyltetrahydrofolate cyclohydrolase FolD [Armatimonadota bacterium]MDW8155204.1 bifunctional methylenetetrahydrofolate dehydrogenase/methenyltetrahydrofolate cyclohydrolase FolD [Armatimonadota bacterium]